MKPLRSIFQDYFKRQENQPDTKANISALENYVLQQISKQPAEAAIEAKPRRWYQQMYLPLSFAITFVVVIGIGLGVYVRSSALTKENAVIAQLPAATPMEIPTTPEPTAEPETTSTPKPSPLINSKATPQPKPTTTPATIASFEQLKQGRQPSSGKIESRYANEANRIESIKSINLGQSRSLIERIMAKVVGVAYAEGLPTISVPTIVFQNATAAKISQLQQSFGFTNAPETPDTYNKNLLVWKDGNRELKLDPSGTVQLRYTDTTTQNDQLAAESTARQAAIEFLTAKQLLPADYDIYVEPDRRYYQVGQNININTMPSGRLVQFILKHQGSQVLFADIRQATVVNKIGTSSMIDVYVGGDNKVAAMMHYAYMYRLQDNAHTFSKKSIEAAIKDLKATGGTIVSLGIYNQPNGSYLYKNRRVIKDAEITQVKLVYFYGNELPGYKYGNDENVYSVSYLTPAWVFYGTGTTYMTTDGTTPIEVKADFASLVYGVTSTDTGIMKVSPFNLTKTADNNVEAHVGVLYDVPMFMNWGAPHPKIGLVYSMLVLYPDNTYLETTSAIYNQGEGDKIVIPASTQRGQVKVYMTLPDFPTVTSQQTIDL